MSYNNGRFWDVIVGRCYLSPLWFSLRHNCTSPFLLLRLLTNTCKDTLFQDENLHSEKCS